MAKTFDKLVAPPYHIYVGEDKHENELLIRWGWPEDVWFHVDKLSSAHVYLRLHKGQSLDDVPMAVIEDCAQLVKANSIQGNKTNDINIVYTMWDNLKKTNGMDVGQVGFHRQKSVHNIHVEKRINEIVNRLNKTKIEEKTPDFRELREERDKKERDAQKARQKVLRQKQKLEEEQKAKEAEARSYSHLMTEDNMKSNQDCGYDSDDFM